MKTLLVIFVLSLPSWATWTTVQQAKGATLTATTCALTVASTGAGHVIVFKMTMANGNTLTGVSGGGTYTLCGATCEATGSVSGAVDMAYTLSSTSGTTTITGTASSSASGATCYADEYSSTTTFAFDTSNKVLDACTTSCPSPALTLTGSNDVISSVSSCGGTCSGTAAGYTLVFQNGDGSAVAINIASGVAFNWTQTSSTALTSASLAIKETGGLVTPIGMDKRRKLQKLGVL